MESYTSSLLWVTLWPIVIYGAYRFVRLNIGEIERREEP
jgi:hypothetical protein